jgi:uncharacterized protein YjiK
LSISSTHCADEKPSRLTLISKYKLDIPEPSALSLSADTNSLWTVSDNNSTVYLISLTGKILSSFVLANAQDLEGVEFVNDSTLAVVSEFSDEIIICSPQGIERSRHKIDTKQSDDHGLEGVAFKKDSNSFCVVNEKNPSLLIELTNDFLETHRTLITSMSDISDIYYDNDEKITWLLSDEDHAIFRFNSGGVLIEELTIEVSQPEGLAYDKQNNFIYVVSDKTGELFVYKLE